MKQVSSNKQGPGTLKVSLVDVTSIRCHERNPRGHDDPQILDIAKSLKHFGQQKAIVLAPNGVDVIAGNGTYTAACSLGWKKINAHVSSLTREQALAYMIADNRTAEKSHWQSDPLSTLLEELRDEDNELFDATGFDLDALMKINQADADELQANDEDTLIPGSVIDADPLADHPSHVRIVQLFLDADTHPALMAWIKALAPNHGTDNITDTVMAVVERAYDELGS